MNIFSTLCSQNLQRLSDSQLQTDRMKITTWFLSTRHSWHVSHEESIVHIIYLESSRFATKNMGFMWFEMSILSNRPDTYTNNKKRLI